MYGAARRSESPLSGDASIQPEASVGGPRASTDLVRKMLRRGELRDPKRPDEAKGLAVMDRLDCGSVGHDCGGRYLYEVIGDGQCSIRRLP